MKSIKFQTMYWLFSIQQTIKLHHSLNTSWLQCCYLVNQITLLLTIYKHEWALEIFPHLFYFYYASTGFLQKQYKTLTLYKEPFTFWYLIVPWKALPPTITFTHDLQSLCELSTIYLKRGGTYNNLHTWNVALYYWLIVFIEWLKNC